MAKKDDVERPKKTALTKVQTDKATTASGVKRSKKTKENNKDIDVPILLNYS